MESQLLYKQCTNGDGDSEAFQQDPRAPMSASCCCCCCCCTRDPLAASCSPCLESGLLTSATKFLQIFWKSTKFKQQTAPKKIINGIFFKNPHNVRMIGTENLWKNLITQIFLLISLKQIVQELCAVRTMQQDETRRDERDGEGNEVLM